MYRNHSRRLVMRDRYNGRARCYDFYDCCICTAPLVLDSAFMYIIYLKVLLRNLEAIIFNLIKTCTGKRSEKFWPLTSRIYSRD